MAALIVPRQDLILEKPLQVFCVSLAGGLLFVIVVRLLAELFLPPFTRVFSQFRQSAGIGGRRRPIKKTATARDPALSSHAARRDVP